MKAIVGAALAVWLALNGTAAVRADDQTDLRAVIDKSLKAVGAEDKVAAIKAMTWKEKGTYYGMGQAVPYTGSYAIQFPDQFKMEITDVFAIVLNKDKGWTKMGGQVTDLTKDQVAEHQENTYASWVATLVPLKDKGFTLSALGDEKVDDKPALGIRVSHKGHRDVNLYFDKDSGILVKSSFRVKAEEQGGKEVSQELWYKDYKPVEGVQQPHKMIMKRDGKQFVEAELFDLKPLKRLDANVFDKP